MKAIRTTLPRLTGAAMVGLLALTLAGCTSSDENVGYTPKGEELLREVWSMYEKHLTERRYPPRNLSDLDPYSPAHDKGYAAVRDGEVVVIWGGSGTAVLAYEKQTPEQGGPVLYRDGTVLQVSGEQLRATLPAR